MKNKSLLDKISEEAKNDFEATDWSGSFWDFEDLLKQDSTRNLRTAYQYVNDMINFFGVEKYEDCGEELVRYKLFDDPFGKGEHAVFGHDRILMELVRNIRTTAETGGEERILILHGPVATSKTSIANLLIKGLEEYSKTKGGGIYTFSWVFVDDRAVNVGFNLPHQKKRKRYDSYADIPSNKIIAEVKCQLNDSPLLLIPTKYREEYLEKIIKEAGLEVAIHKKLLEGELCYNCQTIFSTLLEKYKGDFNQVLKHVKVARFLISQINQQGAATVQPVDNTEGSSPVVTWDGKEYAHLEKILRGIKLHKFVGKWADSNRGIIHFTDMFKKHSSLLQYLLSACQEHLIDFNGVQGYVDIMIVGTTNRAEYENFKVDPKNAALDDRIRKTDIVYLTKINDERKIYQKQLAEAKFVEGKPKEGHGHIAPHWLDMISLWAVLTRLEKPLEDNYLDKELTEEKIHAITGINVYQKAKIYNGEDVPGLEKKEALIIKDKHIQKVIRREHPLEGSEGVSPRIIQNMIIDILGQEQNDKTRCMKVFALFNKLEQLVEGDYEFLKIHPEEGGYRSPFFAITAATHEYHEKIIKEAKWSVIGMEKGEIEKKIKLYIEQVRAHVKNEMVPNEVTGQDEKPSEEMMRWVEERIGVSEGDKAEFRKDILREAAYAHIEKPEEEFDFKEVYAYLCEELETGLFEEKKNSLPISFEQVKYALSKYNTDQFESLEPVYKTVALKIINHMMDNYDYCKYCARDTLFYVMENDFQNPVYLKAKNRQAAAQQNGNDKRFNPFKTFEEYYKQLVKGGHLP